ncbi:MAG: hypothetical protein C0167_03595 [Nitrososphaera sp.]|nr:MAG: hypothetical protein C0167_03595 [Nitrososphaera sp.]
MWRRPGELIHERDQEIHWPLGQCRVYGVLAAREQRCLEPHGTAGPSVRFLSSGRRALHMAERVYGIHRIPIEQVNGNSYIVVSGGDVVIVDTGIPGNAERILKEADSLGSARISAIILTHYHLDHSGSAAGGHRREGIRT